MGQNVGEFILGRLNEWGVDKIYGYPGDGINGLLGAFHKVEKPEFIQVRHEEIAAFAAPRTPSSPAMWACAWPLRGLGRSIC